MPPRTPHSPSGNAGASPPARPVPRPGGDRSASFSPHDAGRPFVLCGGSMSDEQVENLSRTWRDGPPMHLEVAERQREEALTGAPLAVAAIIFLVAIAAFTSGVFAGPAVRQLLAMVL